MMELTPTKKIDLDYNKTREQRILEGMAAWASFYRENPHRFVKDYLNVNLKPFQQTLLMEIKAWLCLAETKRNCTPCNSLRSR